MEKIIKLLRLIQRSIQQLFFSKNFSLSFSLCAFLSFLLCLFSFIILLPLFEPFQKISHFSGFILILFGTFSFLLSFFLQFCDFSLSLSLSLPSTLSSEWLYNTCFLNPLILSPQPSLPLFILNLFRFYLFQSDRTLKITKLCFL